MDDDVGTVEVLGGLSRGDLPLLALTAEEMAVATIPDRDGQRLVPLSHLDGMEERVRYSVTWVSRRSLVARGHLDRNGKPRGYLADILAVRSQPHMIAIADRHNDAEGSHRYLYGRYGGTVLEEQVDDGIHRFTLCTRRSSALRLSSFVDPQSRASRADGNPVVRSASDLESCWEDVKAAVGSIETVTRLFSIRQGGIPQAAMNVSAVVGANGLVVVGGYTDSPAGGRRVRGRISSRALSSRSLIELLYAFLDPTPVHVEPASSASGSQEELI